MKTKTSAVLLAMGLGFTGAANAATTPTGETGVINFIGSIYAGACNVTVEVDDAQTTNATNLVTILPADGSSATSIAAFGTPKDFNIALRNCEPATIANVELALTGDFAANVEGVVNASYDSNTAANANKLGLQIKANSTVVDWRSASANLYGVGSPTAGDTHDIPMSVGYYSLDTNAVPGGIVRATVNYLVSYY